MDNGVTVTGTGQASAPADRLRLMVRIGCQAADVSTAVTRLGQRTETVLTALREHGLGGSDLQTTGVSVHPAHDAMGMPAPGAGFRADHTLTVISRDLSDFGELIDTCVTSAGNDLTVDHVAFDIADPSALLAQAREAAFADARAKAEHLATLAGRELGGIESVSQTGPEFGGGIPLGGRNAMKADLAVAPAEHTAEVALTIHWSWA